MDVLPKYLHVLSIAVLPKFFCGFWVEFYGESEYGCFTQIPIYLDLCFTQIPYMYLCVLPKYLLGLVDLCFTQILFWWVLGRILWRI